MWKDIREYQGHYQISNLGRVRSVDRHITCLNGRNRFVKGHMLKTFVNDRGYRMVRLFRNSRARSVRVHRLVAQAFLPNPKHLPCVNHLDFDRANARADNLNWCTYAWNAQYTHWVNQSVILNRYNRRRLIQQFDVDGNLVGEYRGAGDVYELYGTPPNTTYGRCEYGKIAKDGSTWRYADREVS